MHFIQPFFIVMFFFFSAKGEITAKMANDHQVTDFVSPLGLVFVPGNLAGGDCLGPVGLETLCQC